MKWLTLILYGDAMLYRVTYNRKTREYAVGGAICTKDEALEWLVRGIQHRSREAFNEAHKILGSIKHKAFKK
jgi:hypothetical protein